MKILYLRKVLFVIVFLFMAKNTDAQHKLSFDLAAIRNMGNDLMGLNVSCFNHFTEKFVGGLEVNRFFAASRVKDGENIRLSAWDLDFNFQYHFALFKKWKIYPIAGVSHTSEREWTEATNQNQFEKFWSFNTGAGTLVELGKWSPHIEYTFSWGKTNQQFLLAGISYELEWGKQEKENNK